MTRPFLGARPFTGEASPAAIARDPRPDSGRERASERGGDACLARTRGHR